MSHAVAASATGPRGTPQKGDGAQAGSGMAYRPRSTGSVVGSVEMAYGTAEQGGDGTDESLADFVDLPSGSPTHGQRAQTPFVSAPAIGKLQKVMGSVTITRANVIVAQPAVGDLVYEGDLIETGIDGLVAIVFVDGTTFRLYDSAHMVLDEFVFSAERSANSALFRVLKGRFSFLSGLVATTGRLMIDTAVARIQNTRPAAGIGGLAFSVFTIGLIHELNAASADIALLDDGTITCKDLKHGVFEIVTKGDHPHRYIVDDPCVSIHFQIVGSQVRVSEVANTPGQMALFHDAFLSTLDSFLRGQQELQQLQHAGVQSTFTVGSSTPLNELNNLQLFIPENIGTSSISNPNSNSTNTTTTATVFLTLMPVLALPASSNIVIWTSSSSGTWEVPTNWNPGVPAALDTVEINVPSGTTSLPFIVTVDEPASGGGLLIGPGVVLDIIGPDGSLTLSNATINNAGTIEATNGGILTIDPSTIINSGTFEANGGTIDLTNDKVTNSGELLATGGGALVLSGDTVTNTTTTATVEVDAGSNLDLGSTTISGGIVAVDGLLDSTGSSAIDGAAITIAATTGELEATAGTLTIDGGSISNNRELLATGSGTTLILESLTVTNSGTANVEVDAGSALDLESATISGGNVTVDGTLNSTGSSFITDVVLTNTGTIEATSGTLTIDLSTTITSAGTMEAVDATLLLANSVKVPAYSKLLAVGRSTSPAQPSAGTAAHRTPAATASCSSAPATRCWSTPAPVR